MNDAKSKGSPGPNFSHSSVAGDNSVVGLRDFGGGTIEVIRKGQAMGGGGGVRGKIQYLSSRARTKMLFTLSVTKVEFKSMITLTYPAIHPTSGVVVKRHLNKFRVTFARAFGGSQFWFLEFQRRGAPHFHLLSTVAHPSELHRATMAELWVNAQSLLYGPTVVDIVSRETIDLRYTCYQVHRHKKAWEELRSKDGAIKYTAKYALKTYQKAVPAQFQDVGRFWGCSQDVRKNVREPVDIEVDSDGLMALLKAEEHSVSGWDYYPKYLFGVKASA